MSLTREQKAAIDRTRRSDGKVYPADLVKVARNEKSALHALFQWDDAKAAHAYRIEQARTLIQVYVTDTEGSDVRAYVSLLGDRGHGGGYTRTDDAVASEVTRAQLVAQMKSDIAGLLRQYSYLRPFVPELFEKLEDAVALRRVAAAQSEGAVAQVG